MTVVIVFLFYRVNCAVAMAAGQNIESAVEPRPEAEGTTAPDIEPEIEESMQPEDELETEENMQPEDELETEKSTQPEDKPETGENTQPEDEPETGEEIQPDVELQPETGQSMEPVMALQAEPVLESAVAAEPEQSISTGSELIAWLESHKNTGGRAKLSDNVVLDGYYCFSPNGINAPVLFVDTDEYTITVAGEIEFLSDNHLIFSGQPDGKCIFHVASNGFLSMLGVTVESEQGALQQEEGAGLVVSNCSVSGDIHYADTPFVMYYNNICAVVENGQTIDDVLPSQINCTVNRQGRQFNNESVSVSWDTEGTEEQQGERLRFRIQGSFLNAASAEPAFCTVVYNDYPLTFTDVKATASGFLYTFQGGFTAPEKSLPFTVMSEYSFDGENWFLFEEQAAKDTNASFYIACKHEQKQRGRAAQSNIYIRLQWNDNGTRYFSNVLCYSSDDLEIVEDIGGSRGGGISIINPPDEPQQSISDVSSEGEGPEQNAGSGTRSENAEPKENSSDTKQTENGDGDSAQAWAVIEVPYTEYADADAGQLPDAETSNIDQVRPSNAGRLNNSDEQMLYAESNADNIAGINQNDASVSEKEQGAVAAVSVNEGNSENLSEISEQTLHTVTRQDNYIIIVTGFVLLSVIGGMAGFYVRSRSGTNR